MVTYPNFGNMRVPQSPLNTILVQIDKKYQDEINTEGGLMLYKDTSFNPEWNVTVTGKVVATPARVTSQKDGKHYQAGETRHLINPIVQAGDELFFSYRVVEDKEVRKDSEAFTEATESGSMNKVFTNGKREQLQLQHFSKRFAVCIYTDDQQDLIEGCQGTPKECEKWLAQFRFAGEDNTVFKNLLDTGEGDYWMVDYLEAIAVKRGEEIIMIAGNVLCEEQVTKKVYEINPEGLLHLVPKIDMGILKVVAIGDPLKGQPTLGINPGDTIKVNQHHVQKYELWGKHYTLINQSSIYGKA